MSEFFNQSDYFLITPGVLLALFGGGILLIDFQGRHRFMNAVTAIVGLAFTLWQLMRIKTQLVELQRDDLQGLSGSLIVDHFAIFFMFICIAATLIAILISV